MNQPAKPPPLTAGCISLDVIDRNSARPAVAVRDRARAVPASSPLPSRGAERRLETGRRRKFFARVVAAPVTRRRAPARLELARPAPRGNGATPKPTRVRGAGCQAIRSSSTARIGDPPRKAPVLNKQNKSSEVLTSGSGVANRTRGSLHWTIAKQCGQCGGRRLGFSGRDC